MLDYNRTDNKHFETDSLRRRSSFSLSRQAKLGASCRVKVLVWKWFAPTHIECCVCGGVSEFVLANKTGEVLHRESCRP